MQELPCDGARDGLTRDQEGVSSRSPLHQAKTREGCVKMAF